MTESKISLLSNDKRPLIAHIIYRLDVGGLENGVVNLINNIPEEHSRHVIISLTDASDFRKRITRSDVPIFCLYKKEGKNPALYYRIWRILLKLQPDIVHTRNLATIEAQVLAWLARVPARVHGEHGWDMADLYGGNRKHRMLRRSIRPLIHRYIALSQHIYAYLKEHVHVQEKKITQIYNGVNQTIFHPANAIRSGLPVEDFVPEDGIVIGTVGRMCEVKDQLTLVTAFVHLVQERPDFRRRARLVLVGDGPLREQATRLLSEAGMSELAWLPGNRNDIAAIMRAMDLFVLPSLSEGISNTILEAMATGLPVVATKVGGNPDLVIEGITGSLIPANDPKAMATAIRPYLESGELRIVHGRSANRRIEEQFSLDRMVEQYIAVYDGLYSGQDETVLAQNLR